VILDKQAKSSWGGVRPNAGRKRKADEATMRELVSPYKDKALETVIKVMNESDKYADRLAAAKLILEYYGGKPTQMMDVKTDAPVVFGFSLIPPTEYADSDQADEEAV
jgi:hypothetical protein